MIRSIVKNATQAQAALALMETRINNAGVALFRRHVWALFLRILENTPQYSGKAVANWNVSVGAPNYTVYAQGENEDVVYTGGGRLGVTEAARHEKGSLPWIQVAVDRNKWVIDSPRIRRESHVFISNGVRGDTDSGRSLELYLESLQHESYWADKLRAENVPYETVQETVMSFSQADIDAVRFTGDYTRIRVRP